MVKKLENVYCLLDNKFLVDFIVFTNSGRRGHAPDEVQYRYV